MSDAIAFWIASLAIAAIALPIAFRLFARFPDGGAGLAFALGLVLAAYIYFILRVLRLLPDGRGGFVAAAVALAFASAWFAGDRKFRATLRRSVAGVATAAVVFTTFFFLATVLRSYTPDIAGTEQPMDFLYLNAAIESPAYPPHDPWLAGERSSYYYFGYIQAAVLTEVAGVPSSTGYNLALAFTFASAACAIVSVVGALVRWASPRWRRNSRGISAATAAVWMLLFCGSLVAVFEWFAAHGHTNETIFGLFDVKFRISCVLEMRDDVCFSGGEPRTSHWYPDQFFMFFPMTRTIPGTITEFPVFSFMLGDLHPHVTAIPLVLLTLAISASIYRGRGTLAWRSHRARPVESVIVALIFGALAFQNAWDVLTLSSILGVAVLTRNLRGARLLGAARSTAGYLGPMAAVGVIAFVPWYLDFSSQASGLYPYVGEGTSPAHVFVQWGPIIAAGLLSLGWLRRTDLGTFAGNLAYTLWIPLLPLGLWAALAAFHGDLSSGLSDRTAAGWVTLVALAGMVASLASAFTVYASRHSAAALPAGMAAMGVLLLYGAELLLIRDVFFGGIPRLNTVFKLSYQAWILLAASGAVSLAAALTPVARRMSAHNVTAEEQPTEPLQQEEPTPPTHDSSLITHHASLATEAPPAATPPTHRQPSTSPFMTIATGGVLLLVGLAGVYAIIGWPNRTSGFENERSIDGLSGLSRSDPAEYALVRWVAENVPAGATIVEATGRTWRPDGEGVPMISDNTTDYTDSGRIAARTGRANPIGWYFHEIQWRGDTETVRNELVRRQDLVDSVYTSRDATASLAALNELGAEYVVLGRIEQFEYDQSLWPPFDSFMDLVFESGDVRVYRLPVYKAISTS